MSARRTYHVELCGISRELPLFEVAPGVRIAVFNILGDVEITRAVGKALADRLRSRAPQVVVTAEAKALPLAYEVAGRLELPYVVLRKTYRTYMGDALKEKTNSITTGDQQTLYLDEKDRARISGQKAAIVDDVISTGSTLAAMRALLQRAGANLVAEAAVFTEGDRAKFPNVIALGHLPVFADPS